MNRIFALALTALLAVSQAFAADPAKKAEDLVKKAALFIKEKGKDAALKEFNNPKGKFVDGEFYVFAFTMGNIGLAHPMNPGMVGKDVSNLPDADGKHFFKTFQDVVNKSGSGWVDYKWNNPVTKKIQQKSSYVMKIDGQDMYIGCGIYK